jgi:hypothetical protein
MKLKKLIGILMLCLIFLIPLVKAKEIRFLDGETEGEVPPDEEASLPEGETSLPEETQKPTETEIKWNIFGVEIKLSDVLAIAVVAAFIFALLLIGGVIRAPGGFPWLSFVLFIITIIIFLIVPFFIPYPQYLSVPESFKQMELPSLASQVFILLGLPQEWTYIPAIIYLFILPFAAIYTLVWAFLQSLGIFANVPSSINRVLAFIITFLTIPFGWFVKFVWILFSFIGVWSVVIFATTFVVGAFFRGWGVGRREYALALKTYESVHHELLNKLTELKKKVDGLSAEDIMRLTSDLAGKYGALYPKIRELYARVLTAETVDEKRKIVKEFKLE